MPGRDERGGDDCTHAREARNLPPNETVATVMVATVGYCVSVKPVTRSCAAAIADANKSSRCEQYKCTRSRHCKEQVVNCCV